MAEASLLPKEIFLGHSRVFFFFNLGIISVNKKWTLKLSQKACLLSTHTSEQGNVIGLVSVYIYICILYICVWYAIK